MCAQNVSYLEKRWKVFFEMISYFTITYKVHKKNLQACLHIAHGRHEQSNFFP